MAAAPLVDALLLESGNPTLDVKQLGGTGCTHDWRLSRRIRDAVHGEAVQRRMDKRPDTTLLRKRTIEHVFGTLKHWMDRTHFLTRGIENVSTEVSLSVLAYNLKRVISILGIAKTMKAMRLAGA